MSSEPTRKLLFFITEDWYFCSHRLELARAAKQNGFEVVVVTQVQEHGEKIKAEGFKLVPISLSRSGYNPLKEIQLIIDLIRIYRAECPAIVHHVAIKPVIYGSIAARVSSIPAVVNALAGLGFIFSSTRLKARILRPFVELAYRLALKNRYGRVILQNPDDIRLLTGRHILPLQQAVLIRGSGVNLQRYVLTPEREDVPLVVLAARMLWDKGILEFVEAAQLLHVEGILARFALVGDTDPANPAVVPERQLREWQTNGIIEWWGQRNNMPQVFAQANVVCLPSYREGLPKVLIEAAACGRPIVTTDVPGCREVVREGVNGFLVPVHDSHALAHALRKLIENPQLRQAMGMAGRKIAEEEFAVEHVIRETLRVYRELLA